MASKLSAKAMEEHLKSMVDRLACHPVKADLDHKDLNASQKRWLIVGVCLHSIMSPQLRRFIEPEVKKLYNAMVTAHQIDTQTLPNILEKYPPPNGYRLNYQSINNNTVYGRNFRNFDYKVKDDIDFSKLFLLPHMAHYTGFDESCDSSALLGLILNIQGFQPALRNVIDKLRTEVRNDWAHCDFRQWDENKFARAFQLLEQAIRQLQLQPPEEKETLDMLTKWQTKGQHMLDGGKFLSGVLNEIQHEMSFLARYMLNLETTVMDTVPPNIREQHFRIIENWTKQDEHFIETEGFRHSYAECLQHSYVTITGNSGSGKSAIAYHIALKLSTEGYSILPITSFDEIQRFWDPHNKQLFVYDDPIGTETLDVLKMSDLQTRNSYLESLFNESSSKLVFTCRSIVINDNTLKATQNMLTQHVIDLHADSLTLSKQEKIQMLEHYTKNLEGNNVDADKVTDMNCFNFPFLCSIYAKNEKYQSKGGSFFDNMFPILLDELDHLRDRSPLKYLFLVLSVVLANEKKEVDPKYCSNKMELAMELAKSLGTSCSFSRESLRKAAESLLNVYLIKEGETFKFIHDTLFEAVACHFGKEFPREILKHCSSSFLREHVIVGKAANSTHVICIKPNDYEALAARYISDIEKGLFRDIFLSGSLKDDNVMVCLMKELDKMPNTKLRLLFLEHTASRKMTGSSRKGSWDRSASIYMLLEEENVTPVHWILALHHSRLFDHLFSSLRVRNAPHKVLSNFIQSRNGHSLKRCLIPMACVGGNTEILSRLLSDGCFGKMKDVWGKRKLSTLHMAVLSGQLEMVEMVLKANVDANIEDERGITPLFQAAAAGLSKICDILIRNGANINKRSKLGETPLFIASQEGHISVVSLLLQCHCDITVCRDDAVSPLFIAVFNQHLAIAKLLMKHGSDPNKLCIDGTSCLYVASKNGCAELVRLLLEHGATVSMCKNGETPLIAAARGGFIEIGEILLKRHANINACSNKGESPISVAAQNEQIETFHTLLQHGADIQLCDSSGKSLLFNAADRGLKEIVEILLKLNLDPNKVTKDGTSSLLVAAEKEFVDIVKLLLAYKANVNIACNEGISPLLASASKGNLEIVQLLVWNMATVNQTDKEGKTPLYIAAENGNNEVVKFLLQSGAEINKPMEGRWTPLHVSVREGHNGVTRTLLEHGADLNLCSDIGKSPLITAAEYGQNDIVQPLIQNGAGVNAIDAKGRSALFWAATGGYFEIVRTLKQNKADVNLCANHSESPLINASYYGHNKVVQELTDHGALVNAQNEVGETAIYCAALKGHNDIILTLLKNGAHINICKTPSISSLMAAAGKGHILTVQLLLRHGADINKRTCLAGHTFDALTVAAVMGHSQIVALISQRMRPLYKCK